MTQLKVPCLVTRETQTEFNICGRHPIIFPQCQQIYDLEIGKDMLFWTNVLKKTNQLFIFVLSFQHACNINQICYFKVPIISETYRVTHHY